MALIKTVERLCPHCGGNRYKRFSQGFDYEYHTCENSFSFVSCDGCGLVYLNPTPLPEKISEVYPEEYKPFHFTKKKTGIIITARNFLEKRKAARYRSILPENASILDVGCGDGRYLKILEQVGTPQWNLIGVDFGETAVARAREQGVNAILGAYETLDLGESSYDLIILNQVFEHFMDPASMVEKAHKELRTGGYINIETPSLEGWDARLFRKSYWGGYHFPRHIVLFSANSIKFFLESRGFEIVRINYLLSPVFWVFSMHHVIENTIGIGARFFSDKNPVALAGASALDIVQKLIRSKTSNMQVIARKVT